MNEYDYLRRTMTRGDKTFMIILVSLFLLINLGILVLGVMGVIK